MAENMAITPPSLLGIDRRIAYAQRKYHSGLMWIGVTRGFAGRKFSGSANILGVNITTKRREVIIIMIPKRSLEV